MRELAREIDQTTASERLEQRPKSVLIMKRLRKGSHRLISGVGRSRERPIAYKRDHSLELVCLQHLKMRDWIESPASRLRTIVLALDQHRLIRSFHLDLQGQSLLALHRAGVNDISFHDKQVS